MNLLGMNVGPLRMPLSEIEPEHKARSCCSHEGLWSETGRIRNRFFWRLFRMHSVLCIRESLSLFIKNL